MITFDKQSKPGDHYQERKYRRLVDTQLLCEQIRIQETDLAVYCDQPTPVDMIKQSVFEQRGYLEAYIRQHPGFATTLTPWAFDVAAPGIVRTMIAAASETGVGPMAAVAGAIAEQVGKAILATAGEVIVENGGDIFLHTRRDVCVGLFAGASPLSMKLGLKISSEAMPCGVCTSSGRIGHSLSFGSADAVCVVSSSCPLADAAATAIGNRVGSTRQIQNAIDWGRSLSGIKGIVIIVADKIGVWGEIELVPL